MKHSLTPLLLLCSGLYAVEKPELREQGGQAFVLWNGDKIVELTNYRRLRFRSSGDNNRWLGVEKGGMDLCWDYLDVNDYVVRGKSFRAEPGRFVLEIEADKPSVSGRVYNRLEGRFVSPEVGFEYTLSSRIAASQKQWREVARRARGKKPSDSLPIEFLDYHINRISQSDLYNPRLPWSGEKELYDGFAISEDGKSWRLIPKVPVPQVLRKGSYPAVEWNTDHLSGPGHRLAILDRREGGWLSELIEASSPLKMSVCWMYYDLHHVFPQGVPAWNSGKDTFEANYALTFKPVMPGQARELLDRAKPIVWSSLPEYQLPVFERYSTFDRMLSGNSQYAWLATSYACSVDRKVGYDDTASLRIRHERPGEHSAWYAWTWGPGFDTVAPLEGKYRFSALVKTEGVVKPFRLAVAEFFHDLWYSDGKWVTNPGKPETVLWTYSPQQVSGTSGWTRVSIDMLIDNQKMHSPVGAMIRRGVVVQHFGEGTVWADNVRIERVE